MPKVKIVCLILATVLASVGTILVISNLGGGEIPPLDVPTEDINTYLDKPEGLTPADVEDVRENLFIAHKALLMRESFYGVSTGFTTSFGISQEVLNSRYVVGEFGNKNSFKEMITKGVVPNAYQLYMWGDNYIYRSFNKVNALDDVDWKDSASKLNEDDFYNKFGHRSDKLTGYILNYDTVTNGVLEGVSDGVYTYRFTLDNNDSTAFLKKEMVTNGNLNDYPTFHKAEIVVTMDEEWNIFTLTTDCEYTAKTMGISARCSEDITETFYDFEGELPEKDFFEQFFDADYSDVAQEKGALDVLLDIFSPYLNGQDLQVALDVKQGDAQYVHGLVSISGLDISDLSKLSVAAKIGSGLNVGYEHGEGKIYLKYQDFQASTTVDGVVGLVDTLLPLFGQDGGDAGDLLGDFDLDGLLNNLTYAYSEDGTQCVVSLPLALAGLDIDAKLYADVDGENYSFTVAVITIGEVTITLAPQEWSVEQRLGAYPEILGLADLIKNGKIALSADLALALDGVDFDISADALVDIATLNVELNATLGNNGEIKATLYDKILYAQYGEIKIKLDTANVDSLLAVIEKLAGKSLAAELPEVSVAEILGLLSTITATGVENGRVALSLSLGELNCSVLLASVEDRWQLESIAVAYNGINATVAPSDTYGEVSAPADVDSYVDVTELLETFAEPIAKIINGDSFGASFALNLTLGAKSYLVKGSVAVDVNKTLSVSATVSDGSVTVLDAKVVYGNDTVFLTVNGLKAAFSVNNDGASDVNIVETITELLNNEQIAAILSKYEALNDLVEKVVEIAKTASNFDLKQLLAVDFREIVTRFEFVDGALALSLDGNALGFDVAVDVALMSCDGDLTAELSGLQLASLELGLVATITTDVETIAIPNPADYVLNLHGEIIVSGVAVDLEITADLFNMDVWATAQVLNETILLRFVDNTVYVMDGSVRLKLDATNVDEIVSKLGGLFGVSKASLGSVNIEEILSSIKFDLNSATPNISVVIAGVVASVNFVNVDGTLQFNDISASDGNGKFSVTVERNGKQAYQLDVDGDFVDVNELIGTFADRIVELLNSKDFGFSLFGNVTVGDRVYTLNVSVLLYGSDVHVRVRLFFDDVNVLNADLWIVDNVLYIESGYLRLSLNLPVATNSNSQLSIDDIKQTLGQLKGYNGHLDDLVDLVSNLLDTQLEDLTIADLLFKFAYADGNLTLGVDGSQFGLSRFELALGALNHGVNFAVSNLAYKDMALNLSGTLHFGNYNNVKIVAPSGDFTTNLKVIIDESNTLYVNIDLINRVIKLKLESVNSNGKTTTLDILYTLSDNIVKITNGQNLYVSADINNIAEIVRAIDGIVHEFAGAETEAADAMAGLAGLGDIDFKAILQSLHIDVVDGKVIISFVALGFDVTASFTGGSMESVLLPIADGLTLTVKTDSDKADYADFPEDAKYVRIDQVFNDYFYGDSDEERGAIDTLIHTNSWRFDFNSDSEIEVTNDDGTVDKYQLAAGSFLVFYYNVTEAENFKIRAKLNINKWGTDKWNEFIILDVAYIDGRIYVNYDSNSSNKNVLKATVSLDAIKGCINLLPSLYKVVPQVEDLINNLKQSMSEAQGSITLGNLASLFEEVTYNDDKVFTLSLNDGIIAGLGKIYLSAQQFGNVGLQLNELTAGYNNVSIRLSNVVVTASDSTLNDDGSRNFHYVDQYISTYLDQNGGYNSFMNLDSIRELLAGFVITADNADADGNRSFALQGTVHANMIGLAKVDIQIYVNVDIDKDNNVYVAVKIHRDSATGLAGGLAYDDEGGDSYLLLDGKDQLITIARNSIQKQTWCSQNGFHCTNTSTLHKVNHLTKKTISDYDYKGQMSYLVENLPLSEFSKDTTTLVNYILELINFTSTIEKPIKNAIGKENTNVFGIEDILKSYSYSYNEKTSEGTFAVGADLAPIDSALGDVSVNILHVGNFNDVYYDDDGNFHDGGVALTQINGSASMIKIMDATFELNLLQPTSGLARGYVEGNNYRW